MSLRVSGKNMNIGEALRTHVQEKVAAIAAKYSDGAVSGHITIAPEGSGFRADCSLRLSSGVDIESDGRAQEPYACFDQAADRMEKRLRRHKSRLKGQSKHQSAQGGELVSNYVLEAPDEDTDAPVEGDFAPTVIAESTMRMKSLTIAAAVMEMDLTGAPVLPFRHAASGRVNLIYRRSDGNIGWIDPAAAERNGKA